MTIQEKDSAYIWHPYTQEKTAGKNIPIVHAKGSTLFTEDGREIIDAVSSWWVNIHGHSNPVIADAIAKQAKELEHVIFAGFTHRPATDLAEMLLQMLSGHFSKVFYSDNGSTAVEVGVKMALQYFFNCGEKQRKKIVALEDAYHGDTFGAMAVSGKSAFTAPFNELLFEVIHIPRPDDRNVDETVNRMKDILKAGDVAAFIFEPLVQGAAGMQMYKAEHLDRMMEVAHEAGILCIADEVMTGFGRTGKTFAKEYLNREPDIICLSKGITGGFMPLGVTACTDKIYDAFYSDDSAKTFFHGHSYTANPLACAAAIASIRLLNDDSCRNQIGLISDSHKSFGERIQSHALMREVRQKGTILAIELNTSESSSYFHSVRDRIYEFCLSRNVLLRPLGNIIYLMPPYCITREELNRIYSVIQVLLDALGKNETGNG